MRFISKFLVVLSAVTVFSPASWAATGRMEASFSVTPTGGAQYTIPIRVIPGRNGLTPQLGLTYSSRGGDGYSGVGWSISGLSSITRCNKTIAQDGVTEAPTGWSNGDRLCLDGNQLRLTAGSYFVQGAEYATELDSYSRIRTPYCTSPCGFPQNWYFLVERADGLLYEYGSNVNSRDGSYGTGLLTSTWRLTKIRDRANNEITFEYSNDANDRGRLLQVRYNGTANRVEFIYETKPASEIDVRYNTQQLVQLITRLTRIDVFAGSTVTRRYNVNYEPTLSSASKSRIASVQECGISAGDCYGPTAFTYQNGQHGVGGEVFTGLTTPAQNATFVMDVNGDGWSDIVYPSSDVSGAGVWMYALGQASGFAGPYSTGVSNVNFDGALPTDYNGDGRDDLLVALDWQWWVIPGTLGGLSGSPIATGVPAVAAGDAISMDINGDGLDDLIWSDTTNAVIYARHRDLNGTYAAPYVYNGLGTTMPGIYNVLNGRNRSRQWDLDGDGKADASPWPLYNAGGAALVLNVNGDSYQDAAGYVTYFNEYWGEYYGSMSVLFSDGTGGQNLVWFDTVPWLDPLRAVVIDWDGDGYDDILSPSLQTGTWFLHRSIGTTFSFGQDTGVPAPNGTWVATLDRTGNGLSDIVYANAAGQIFYRERIGPKPDLLNTATDAFENTVGFAYTTLPQSNYSKYNDATYPYRDFIGPLDIVSQQSVQDGVGGTYNIHYHYWGGVLNLQGRGFSGFYAFRPWDSRDGIHDYYYYHRTFPYTGSLLYHYTWQPDWTPIRQEDRGLSYHLLGSGDVRYHTFDQNVTVREYEVGGPGTNGAHLRTIITTKAIDASTGAEVDTIVQSIEAGSSNGLNPGHSHTQRTQLTALSNDWGNWCIGRPSTLVSTESHTMYGGTAQSRTTQFSWDGASCRLTSLTAHPGHPDAQVTTAFGYDGFGNVNSETVYGVGVAARTTTRNWGGDGRFLVSETNAAGETSSATWDYLQGAVETSTDSSGLTTSWQYDLMGRRTSETRPDGTSTIWTHVPCNASNGYCGIPGSLRGHVWITHRNSASQASWYEVKYYDRFDRFTHEYAQRLGNVWSYVGRSFTNRGFLNHEHVPYQGTQTDLPYFVFSYDLIGRELTRTLVAATGSRSWATSYRGFRTVRTDPLGKTTTVLRNAIDQTIRQTDHDGFFQQFDFGPFGTPVRTTNSLGQTLQAATFNVQGLPQQVTDADRGTWTFSYNAAGEQTGQTDANGATSYFAWDALSRPTSRSEPAPGGGTILSQWAYGNSVPARNVGKLTLAQISGSGISTYSETHLYDGVGRLSRTEHFDGSAYHVYDYTYNAIGALESIQYPTNVSGGRFKVVYDYAGPEAYRARNESGSVIYWQANTANAFGSITDESLGNGLRTTRGFDLGTNLPSYIRTGPGGGSAIQNLSFGWDTAGNLTSRQDANQGLTETFAYDNLYRLDYSQLNGSTNLDLSYGSNGNITWRSGVGSYAYHPSKPHAVTTAGSWSYGYDNNGNVTSKNGSSVTWYTHGRPRSISSGGFSSTFEYSADGQYWKQTASFSNGSETTTYIGGLFERVVNGGTTEDRHYILADGRRVAVESRRSDGGQPRWFLLLDHLRSVTALADSAGGIYSFLSYDAFGKRRGPSWTGSPSQGDINNIAASTRRGYTEHSMLDNIGLVHMNGRVMDPAIGRFLSADPFVDEALGTQGWNRYSYIGNDPLSAVDLKGFCASGVSERHHSQGAEEAGCIPTITITASRIISFMISMFQVSTLATGYSSGGGADPSLPGVGNTGPSPPPPAPAKPKKDNCWNGKPGRTRDFFDGVGRATGNSIVFLSGAASVLSGVSIDQAQAMAMSEPFGSNNTNLGLLGRDVAPALQMALPALRAGYAFEVSRISRPTLDAAVGMRNALKQAYRFHIPWVARLGERDAAHYLAKNNGDVARAMAGSARSNAAWDAAGAGGAVGSAVNAASAPMATCK